MYLYSAEFYTFIFESPQVCCRLKMTNDSLQDLLTSICLLRDYWFTDRNKNITSLPYINKYVLYIYDRRDNTTAIDTRTDDYIEQAESLGSLRFFSSSSFDQSLYFSAQSMCLPLFFSSCSKYMMVIH